MHGLEGGKYRWGCIRMEFSCIKVILLLCRPPLLHLHWLQTAGQSWSPQHLPVACLRSVQMKERMEAEDDYWDYQDASPRSALDHLAPDRHTGFLRSLRACKSQRIFFSYQARGKSLKHVNDQNTLEESCNIVQLPSQSVRCLVCYSC